MTILMVPAQEDEPWPTLGQQVCRFIEQRLVFGPGDLRGEPARLTREKRMLIYRMYEVYPRGHPLEGRRRFRRVGISLRKGLAKTELAAWIAAVELHPEGPVRCDGFQKVDSRWQPSSRPVTDPYIPMVAYTEEQTEDLAYAALKAICELSDVARDFDIGLERIMRRNGDGKAVALATAPNSRDGARTTFQHKDETHLWTMARQKKAAATMTLNLAKRYMAEPWELETTTAFVPGESSVAEETMDYARAVVDGKIEDSRLLYYHRQASQDHDLSTPTGVRDAVIEATGDDNVDWSDIDALCDMAQDPKIDRDLWERMILNRPIQAAAQVFDAARWKELALPDLMIPPRSMITVGFDGSRWNDATALIATHLTTGHQWVLGIWERPANAAYEWEVPQEEVDAVVDEAFRAYDVRRLYADPSWWETQVAEWAGRYGANIVVAFPTVHLRKMAFALKSFAHAIKAGELSHDGNPTFARHVGNANRNNLNLLDEDGQKMWLIQKERRDSPNKIDAAMAATLSWQARNDALAMGADERSGVWAYGAR
jgi:phage terminase large subunit-like protein